MSTWARDGLQPHLPDREIASGSSVLSRSDLNVVSLNINISSTGTITIRMSNLRNTHPSSDLHGGPCYCQWWTSMSNFRSIRLSHVTSHLTKRNLSMSQVTGLIWRIGWCHNHLNIVFCMFWGPIWQKFAVSQPSSQGDEIFISSGMSQSHRGDKLIELDSTPLTATETPKIKRKCLVLSLIRHGQVRLWYLFP